MAASGRGEEGVRGGEGGSQPTQNQGQAAEEVSRCRCEPCDPSQWRSSSLEKLTLLTRDLACRGGVNVKVILENPILTPLPNGADVTQCTATQIRYAIIERYLIFIRKT